MNCLDEDHQRIIKDLQDEPVHFDTHDKLIEYVQGLHNQYSFEDTIREVNSAGFSAVDVKLVLNEMLNNETFKFKK